MLEDELVELVEVLLLVLELVLLVELLTVLLELIGPLLLLLDTGGFWLLQAHKNNDKKNKMQLFLIIILK